MDTVELAMSGDELQEQQAFELESNLAQNPDDITARASLIGYYYLRQHKAPEAAERFIAHVIWFVEKRPADPLTGSGYVTLAAKVNPTFEQAYRKAKKIWEQHIEREPRNVKLLSYAARFLLLEDTEQAEKYLLHAKELEPKNSTWPGQLAHLYSIASMNSNAREKDALAEIERALSLEKNATKQFYKKTVLVQYAFAAGAFDRSKEIAEDLLKLAEKYKDDWNYGNAINSAHTVLGRLALKTSDTEKAKQHLLASAKNARSPQTSSFGPSMLLAAELLKSGEKDVVFAYFDSCESFWDMGSEQMANWRVRIEKGEFPWDYLFKRKS